MGVWMENGKRNAQGPVEQWHPAHPEDWPHDEDPTNPSPALGILPERCLRCTATLTREPVVWNKGQIAEAKFRYQKAVTLAKVENREPPLSDLPAPLLGWHYLIVHAPGCAGYGRHADAGDVVDLHPHRRVPR